MEIKSFLFSVLFLSSCQGQNNINSLPLREETNEARHIISQSNDNGQTWQNLSKGLPEKLLVRNVLMQDGEVYLTSDKNKLYHSRDLKTGVWEEEDVTGIFADVNLMGLFACNKNVYVAVHEKGFFRKVKGTAMWLPMCKNFEEKTINALTENDKGEIFVGTTKGVYKSSDDGKTWQHIFTKGWIMDMTYANGTLIMNSQGGLFRSTDNGTNWENVLKDDEGVYNIAVVDNGFSAVRVHSIGVTAADMKPERTYLSENGKNWQRVPEATFLNTPILDIEPKEEYLFVGRADGVFRSANKGKVWEQIYAPVPKEELFHYEIIKSGQSLLAVLVWSGGC